MKILAIETSCDETGIAIVEGTKTSHGFTFHTLGAALLSQAELHAQYGGVYPNLAKREHEKNLPIMLVQALEKAGVPSPAHVDAIAVTHGPGLEPALWTGINFAKKLSAELSIPLIPVNHMEGHLISSLVKNEQLEGVELPLLCLLISGGHTEFVLMKSWFVYDVIGITKDDAVGEAFDKVARMLGLPYPGGPHIARLAQQSRESGITPTVTLPRPMLHSHTNEFSFSGIKTAALYALRDMGGIQKLSTDEIAGFAQEFENAVTEVLVSKTKHALIETGANTVVIGGGVAASAYIRTSLSSMLAQEFPDVEFRTPEISITGDNAIMIAMAALARSLAGEQVNPEPDTIRAIGKLSLQSPK